MDRGKVNNSSSDCALSRRNDSLTMRWSEIVAKQRDPVVVNWHVVIKEACRKSKIRRTSTENSVCTRE